MFGRHITMVTQDLHSHKYLVQRIVVAVQMGNAAAILGYISSRDNNLIYLFYFFKFLLYIVIIVH